MAKKKIKTKVSKKKDNKNKTPKKKYSTLNIKSDHEIGMDFATKAYKRFNKIVKSIILFGSASFIVLIFDYL